MQQFSFGLGNYYSMLMSVKSHGSRFSFKFVISNQGSNDVSPLTAELTKIHSNTRMALRFFLTSGCHSAEVYM